MGRMILALAIFLLSAGLCLAEETPEASSPLGEQPVRITSDRLEVDDAVNRMTFAGSVVARQGDVAMYAEEMTIFYRGDSREIERIVARQDVRIVQGAKVATGEQGVFYREESRIVLTGSPRVHQGENFVEGEEITVYLDEERSVVRGDQGSRVNAVFHPKGESR